MASSKANPSQHKQQPKKLPPVPKGQNVQRGALPRRDPSTHSAHRIYVNARSPFRSVTARVRKQLDKSLRQASSASHPQSLTNTVAGKNYLGPLPKRIQALQNGPEDGISVEHARQVVVIGTGKAIEKVVNVAAFFQEQRDVEVRLRTCSLGAVDEFMPEEEENGLGLGVGDRERMVSCLEVTIKLR